MTPVDLALGMRECGHVQAVDAPGRRVLPLPVGAVLYSPGEEGQRGELYVVWRTFNPNEGGREVDETGELRVSCAELLLVPTTCDGRPSGKVAYKLDRRSKDKQGSFAPGARQTPWEVSAGLLWSVEMLVDVNTPLVEGQLRGRRAPARHG